MEEVVVLIEAKIRTVLDDDDNETTNTEVTRVRVYKDKMEASNEFSRLFDHRDDDDWIIITIAEMMGGGE